MKMSVLKTSEFNTNCYIILTEQKSVILVDPGDESDKILEIIKNLGGELKYILLTHGHHDHTGAVKPLKSAYPNAIITLGEKDIDMIDNILRNYGCVRGRKVENFEGLKQDVIVKDGDLITVDELTFKVVETPGHTKGGITYICENKMFTGDTLFYESIGRSDLYGGNSETLCQSVTKLMLIDGEYEVYPGHGSSSSMEHERKNNKYVRI
ncbi:MAG: MBL fold metallo-hydrolase [Oscillospiraceae bacterium]